MLLISIATAAVAQDAISAPSKFWVGFALGANLNYYSGSLQNINTSANYGFNAPAAFHYGGGAGLNLTGLFEYHPNKVLGLMINLGYDGRGGNFDKVMTPANNKEALNVKLRYVTFEPGIRVAPFSSDFYFFAGAAFRSLIGQSYTYTLELQPDLKGKFTEVRNSIFSGQIGAGYDFRLTSAYSKTVAILTPFVSYHPYFGQEPRTLESWSISTLRFGMALKFAKAHNRQYKDRDIIPMLALGQAGTAREIGFEIEAPASIPARRKSIEVFPVRNYVFFDEGSLMIPDRYVELNEEEAANFKVSQFQGPEPKDLEGRSNRQMIIYYNILNILGARMRDNSRSNVNLIGSSAGLGEDIGKGIAESVKEYLVLVFGIKGSRITTEGRNQPIIRSEKTGNENDLDLLHDGDRRVDIVSSGSPDLLTPIQISAVQKDPIDSRVIFKTSNGTRLSLNSWSLEIIDETGLIQRYGPYTKSKASISGNKILGDRQEGNYIVMMVGQTSQGTEIKKERKLHLKLNDAPKEVALRFSILFDFDKYSTVDVYEKFLTDVVAPLVPNNSTVIIHGHTDIIGDEAYNMKLSKDRAKYVQVILKKVLSKGGKKGINYETSGFGSDISTAPFENTLPEERFYNRTVIIDIISKI